MRTIRILGALLGVATMLTGVSLTRAAGEKKACCEATVEAGKKCKHECCVKAANDGKVCEKCHPKQQLK